MKTVNCYCYKCDSDEEMISTIITDGIKYTCMKCGESHYSYNYE